LLIGLAWWDLKRGVYGTLSDPGRGEKEGLQAAPQPNGKTRDSVKDNALIQSITEHDHKTNTSRRRGFSR